MTNGVKVVGGPDASGEAGALEAESPPEVRATPEERPPSNARRGEGRRRRPGAVILAVVAVLGVAGTIGFGVAWAGLHAQQSGEAQASASARKFLVDLTNFDSKTVDADFNAITGMATGTFSSQAQKFFNSTIRQELQKALASSRGQVRELYVQSYGGGHASVYAVVDQLYVNSKITSPQTDVLRIVVTMTQAGSAWKVSDVSVLQGPSLAAGTASSGSAATTPTTAPAGG